MVRKKLSDALVALRKTFFLSQGKYLLNPIKSPATISGTSFDRASTAEKPVSLKKATAKDLAVASLFSRESYFSIPKRKTVVSCRVAPGFSSVLGNAG
jgi:hypothetical protein